MVRTTLSDSPRSIFTKKTKRNKNKSRERQKKKNKSRERQKKIKNLKKDKNIFYENLI